MKKTIKIIDLLNKIANSEEVPKKIKYEENIWKLNTLENTYDNGKCCLFEDYIDKKYVITDVLNDEVEIIEEEKKIEKKKIECLYVSTESNKYLVEKINELVVAINELKKGE